MFQWIYGYLTLDLIKEAYAFARWVISRLLSKLTHHEWAYHELNIHDQIHHDQGASRTQNYRFINTIISMDLVVIEFRISFKDDA